MVVGSQIHNELFDKSIVDHVAFRGVDIALSFPHIVKHMVTATSQFQGFFRQPEERQHGVFFILRPWRKNQNESCDVGGTGKVKPCITVAPLQRSYINGQIAPIVDMLWNPNHSSVCPHIQSELLEYIFLRRVLQGVFIRFPDALYGNGVSQ